MITPLCPARSNWLRKLQLYFVKRCYVLFLSFCKAYLKDFDTASTLANTFVRAATKIEYLCCLRKLSRNGISSSILSCQLKAQRRLFLSSYFISWSFLQRHTSTSFLDLLTRYPVSDFAYEFLKKMKLEPLFNIFAIDKGVYKKIKAMEVTRVGETFKCCSNARRRINLVIM